MAISDGFKALSDPTRREILHLLKNGELSAGDIAEQFNMTKPSISHHLTILKQAELVSSEKKGQHVFYALNTSVFEELLMWFYSFQEKKKGE